MKIGELAKLVKCTTATIRFYETIGLIQQANRTENHYRVYNKKHLERLLFIRNCRALEMSHDEIKTLVTIMEQNADCIQHQNAHALLANHLQHIDERINELNILRNQLITLQDHCHSSYESCGILQELVEMEVDLKHGKSHV